MSSRNFPGVELIFPRFGGGGDTPPDPVDPEPTGNFRPYDFMNGRVGYTNFVTDGEEFGILTGGPVTISSSGEHTVEAFYGDDEVLSGQSGGVVTAYFRGPDVPVSGVLVAYLNEEPVATFAYRGHDGELMFFEAMNQYFISEGVPLFEPDTWYDLEFVVLVE